MFGLTTSDCASFAVATGSLAWFWRATTLTITVTEEYWVHGSLESISTKIPPPNTIVAAKACVGAVVFAGAYYLTRSVVRSFERPDK